VKLMFLYFIFNTVYNLTCVRKKNLECYISYFFNIITMSTLNILTMKKE